MNMSFPLPAKANYAGQIIQCSYKVSMNKKEGQDLFMEININLKPCQNHLKPLIIRNLKLCGGCGDPFAIRLDQNDQSKLTFLKIFHSNQHFLNFMRNDFRDDIEVKFVILYLILSLNQHFDEDLLQQTMEMIQFDEIKEKNYMK